MKRVYLVFVLMYCDEPIRYIIMQRHLYSRKWIQPVSDKGLATIEAFRKKYHVRMGYPVVEAVKKAFRKV